MKGGPKPETASLKQKIPSIAAPALRTPGASICTALVGNWGEPRAATDSCLPAPLVPEAHAWFKLSQHQSPHRLSTAGVAV